MEKNPIFRPIIECSDPSGISQYFIRQGVKEGWIPHIRCGNKVMVNYPKFIEILNERSVNQKEK